MAKQNEQVTDWEKWSDRSNITGIVVGLLAFLCTVAIFYTGSRAQAVAKAQFEAKAQEARQQADSAKADAAKANQATEKLKNSNLLLEKDVATLQIRAATAEQQLSELKEKVRPRSLSDAQKATLFAGLKNISKFGMFFQVPSTNWEAENYGEQIADVFKKVGWSIPVDLSMTGYNEPGLHLFVIDRDNMPPDLLKLVNLLRKTGLVFELKNFENVSPNALALPTLFIGPKYKE